MWGKETPVLDAVSCVIVPALMDVLTLWGKHCSAKSQQSMMEARHSITAKHDLRSSTLDCLFCQFAKGRFEHQ